MRGGEEVGEERGEWALGHARNLYFTDPCLHMCHNYRRLLVVGCWLFVVVLPHPSLR